MVHLGSRAVHDGGVIDSIPKVKRKETGQGHAENTIAGRKPMFHLGWFVGSGYGLNSWGLNWAGSYARDWTRLDFHIDLAGSLERASFDYMIFEDGLMIPNAYEGSMRAYLKHALEGPRNDPTSLVAVLSQYTSRIGLIPTISTSFYPPFMAARMAKR